MATNLISLSEPTVAQLIVQFGPTNATTSIYGFTKSLHLAADVVNVQYAYMTFAETAGVHYTFSIFVEMDDDTLPSIGTDSGTGDFALVLAGGLGAAPLTAISTPGVYRCSAKRTGTGSNSNWGIVKYTTQSSKGFRFTGYQIEVGDVAYSYYPVPPYSGAASIPTTGYNSFTL